MTPLGPEEFRAACDVSRETTARLERYAALLETWSRAINLVGRATLPDLWRRHMLDSAQLLDLLPPAPQDRPRRVVDLGSGAGFPGLVLAILGVGEIHLVEADAKKAAFLREVARETGTEIELHVCRIADLQPFPVEAVTARALAPLAKLLDLAEPFLCPDGPTGPTEQTNGQTNNRANRTSNTSSANTPVGLFLKGRETERELTGSAEKWNMRLEVFPSRSDPGGRILRLSELARKERRP